MKGVATPRAREVIRCRLYEYFYPQRTVCVSPTPFLRLARIHQLLVGHVVRQIPSKHRNICPFPDPKLAAGGGVAQEHFRGDVRALASNSSSENRLYSERGFEGKQYRGKGDDTWINSIKVHL